MLIRLALIICVYPTLLVAQTQDGAAQVSTVVAKDGTHIAVECRGKGPSLLIVHGGTGDRKRWAPLLIIGVKQEFRGRGINLALGAHSYLAMIERGYKTASYTVVLDDNWPSRRTAEKLGARVTRNFVVYRKEMSGK